ncbi:phage replisome organizer N-terminal domain-containing protein [Clostridium beijerinckii]|uniref:Phage replisome organizer N-terminal domain-containing protein n=4 Tax=Clostridium beijerinckii TaxID=1520 RepID=A0AAE2UXH8_CLOBE|nr:phage replisome organizer N-terminal domain-containing protein [Clostridium beijerinckii]ABR34383.1 phage replisome organizer, putative [Clostridium beijerinckii NCIMB 8052]AIU04493.1 phage replisome organizer, putative [Clostridium beijerinckii ATCC 35702]MBF7810999.1 phage replisome organizer N-terminal domain-containing protein [Clostridium beijerinckii]NRT24302.1 putative phage replisome organizer [Clostridium beijerinckii]NRT68108.1 putative phage replisome organizer [Clostridium beije
MADIKWIKLATNMHDDEKMKLIDAMPNRDTIHYVWIRILLLGGKLNANGKVFLSEGKPLTAKMLAVLFSRPLEDIKITLKVLSNFGMIEIASDKVIRIVNWDKHQNIEGMERVREQNRKRVENHREKKKEEKNAAKSNKEETQEDKVLEEFIDLEENQDLDESVELEKTNELERKKDYSKNSTIEENKALGKIDILENLETNEDISNNILETADDNCIVTKNNSNVTRNRSNVTVTQQNKKKIDNKKKNKKEKKEIDKDKNIEGKKNNGFDINNKGSACDDEVSQSNLSKKHNNTKSESGEEEDINLKALELMHYHEKITGKPGGCDYVALRSAIDIHGEKMVKMAMDVGFEKNCPDIKYAIGVLKNWRRDGYPEDHMEVKKNGVRSNGKSDRADKNEFAGFKPKEPRKLTEAERKRIEENLI